MEQQEVIYCGCGVPNHLHGTCCGWLNAIGIINPQNEQQAEWKQKWEEAHPNTSVTINVSYDSSKETTCIGGATVIKELDCQASNIRSAEEILKWIPFENHGDFDEPVYEKSEVINAMKQYAAQFQNL